MIIGNSYRPGPLIGGPLGENDWGRAISLIDGVHRSGVESDLMLVVDRSFSGIMGRVGSTGAPIIMAEGRIFVETIVSVKRDDPVLVSAADGRFTTGEPSQEFPELLNASYVEDADEDCLVKLELYFADHIYRIVERYCASIKDS